jgi:hypothetical protein
MGATPRRSSEVQPLVQSTADPIVSFDKCHTEIPSGYWEAPGPFRVGRLSLTES